MRVVRQRSFRSSRATPKLLSGFATNLNRVGKKLKLLRARRGLSQTDMTAYGFELRYYQRLESGKHSLSLFTLLKLSIALRCDLAEIIS